MAERYTRVFSLDKDLYADGSSVLIKAGALLLDNKNNTVLAQMKFQNIGTKRIKALTVGITPLDVAGDINGEEIEFQYLDMSSGRDEIFGEQTPIALPDNTTRGFLVNVKSAVYEDNGRKVVSSTKWDDLPAQETLLHRLGDDYAVKQFQEQYHVDFDYVPVKHKDIWLCGCRAINSAAENNCHRCHFEYKQILTVDDDELRHKGEEVRKEEIRIRQEQQEEAERLRREEEERRLRREEEWKKEQANRRKRIKKISIIAACAVVIIGVIFGCYKYLPPIFTQMEAEKAYGSGDYDKAIELYESINADKQFDKNIVECKNEMYLQDGMEAIKKKDYKKAIAYLKNLPSGYVELDEKDNEAFYSIAKEEIENGSYEIAKDSLWIIGEYKDAQVLWDDLKYYQQALQQLEEGDLNIAKGTLYRVDSNFKNTSKILSKINKYLKFSKKWICYSGEVLNDDESLYYQYNSKEYRNHDITFSVYYSVDNDKFILTGDVIDWHYEKLTEKGNKIMWEDWYGGDNTFDITTGERIRDVYNDDGSLKNRFIFMYE